MTLSNKAMLVDLDQRVWQAVSADRGIAARVEQDQAAQHRTMRVVKQLVPREKLLPINRIALMGREHHDRLTLPGLMKGQQLLATRMFNDYASAQSDIKDAFYTEVKRFSDVYPDIVENAPKRLGNAFRASDFPRVEKIVEYFSYSHRFSPVPDGQNWFLDDVSGDALNALRNEVENEKNDLFREAAKNLMERTKDVLEKFSSQIETYDDARGGKLKDVTINAVKEMAELASRMNITGDPGLDAIAKEMMDNFSTLEGRELRQKDDVRNKIGDIAKRLLKRME